MTTHGTDLAPLRRVSAQLYRQNAFRLTGVPLSATARDIRRQSDMLAILEKTGAPLPVPDLLPLRPEPSSADIRAALDRLADPRQRLVDEFFWFWPVGGGSSSGGGDDSRGADTGEDPALAALAAGDTQAAARLWAAMAENSDRQVPAPDAANALHNVAVLGHLQALDAELTPGSEPPDWVLVYRRWGDVLRDHQVWSGLEERIRRAADARLDADLADTIRTGLPAALLSIGAGLAAEAIAAGERDRAERQLTAMRGARLGSDAEETLGAALRTAGAPWADEIDRLCDSAVGVANGTRKEGLAQAERILTESTGTLERLDLLLPADESTRVRTRDRVAVETLTCLLAFDQARDRPEPPTESSVREQQRMSAATVRAEGVAASETVRERLAENRRILEAATQSFTCWFCEEEPGVSAAMEIWMHGDITRTYPRVSWRNTKVTVPRCSSCESRTSRRQGAAVLRCALYLLVAISIPTMLFPGSGGGFIALAVFAAFAALLVDVLAAVAPAGRREKARLDSFPVLKDLTARGWNRGEKPLGIGNV
ncbi:hypothetical protein CcI49_05770 [Frankia sp. CcI49]|uniref:hypothetical protein n=1 Tax=Frankia sp. CcI49 TaxID=1745382 RepID=UPI00097892B2|nr:hypothetical protein [Frankia sp. CcI49]ONH61695.1 hypothetical protein CcI49_05770 [Frankia sp. CcI49]